MTQNKPEPRRSVFSASAHPLRPDEAPVAALEEPNRPQEASESTARKSAPEKGKKAKEAVVPKRKASFYGDAASLNRMREAFTRNQLDEGYESFSDFIMQAALKETSRLEKKYNAGNPYGGVKQLPSGRPIKI